MRDKTRWEELCKQAAVEQDTVKLMEPWRMGDGVEQPALVAEEPVEPVSCRRIHNHRLSRPIVRRCREHVAPVHRIDAVGVLLQHEARRRGRP